MIDYVELIKKLEELSVDCEISIVDVGEALGMTGIDDHSSMKKINKLIDLTIEPILHLLQLEIISIISSDKTSTTIEEKCYRINQSYCS